MSSLDKWLSDVIMVLKNYIVLASSKRKYKSNYNGT